MKAVSAELAAAITSNDQTLRPVVMVDWDNDGYGPAGSLDDLSAMADTVNMSQTVTSATPDGVRVVEGSISKAATVDITRGGILYPAGQVAYRDVSTAVTGASAVNTLTVNKPAAARSGDYMLLAYSAAHPLARPRISPAWTPLGSAVAAPLVTDAFGRTVAAGFGTADSGQTWTVVPGGAGTNADFAVTTTPFGHATITPAALSADYKAVLSDTSAADHDVIVDVAFDALPASGLLKGGVVARYTDTNNFYSAEIAVDSTGAITLNIRKVVTGTGSLVASLVTGQTYVAGVKWRVKFAVAGSGTGATQRAKTWRPDTTTEPAAWLTAADSSLSTGTQVGVFARNESASAARVFSFDDFSSYSDLVTYLYGRWCADTEPASYTIDWDPFAACSASAVIVAAGGAVQHQPGILGVQTSAVKSETASGTSHTTSAVTTTSDGCLLVTFWAARVAASGSWSGYTGGDTERADVIGSSTSVNVALSAAMSATQPAGTYSRTATSSVATAMATMVIVALAPVPAGDERRTAARHLARDNNTDSPLVGKERNARPCYIAVEYPTTTGPQQVRRLTGRTRRTTIDAAARTASLDFLDGREQMRGSLLLPAIAGYQLGCNASWAISYAAWKSGFYVSPPARTGCRMWWPGHGSGAPFISSTLGPSFTGLPTTIWASLYSQQARTTFVPGPFLLGMFAGITTNLTTNIFGFGEGQMAPGTSLVAADGNSGRLELWVRADATSATAPFGVGQNLLELNLDPNQVAGNVLIDVGIDSTRKPFITMNDGHQQVTWNPAPALPSDGAWHFLGFHWDYANNVTTMRVDTTDYTSSWVPAFVTDRLPATEGVWENEPFISAYLPIAEVQITATANTTPWLNAGFTPTAYIDPSTIELEALAERDPYEAWQLTQELAEAEQGVSYFDEDGVYRYQTRRRRILPAAQTVQRVLTEQTLAGLASQDAIDTVRNEITVEYNATAVSRGLTIATNNAWDTTDVYTIQPGQTLDLWAAFNDPAIGVAPVTMTLLDPLSPANLSWVTGNLSADGTGLAVTDPSQVNARIVYVDAGQAHIKVTNLMQSTLYLANNANIATIRVAGQPVTTATASSVARDTWSQQKYGIQPYQMPTNKWIHRQDVAASVAYGILADLKDPLPIVTDLDIVADPRLQIGDRIQLYDRTGLALQRDYWITGFPREEITADGGYRMSIAARPAANQYLVGTGLVGVDLIGT